MKKYALQSVVDLVNILAHLGLKEVVLSPGSRNAPLTIAFARHPSIQTYSVSDERAAGFIAMGMAQQLGRPVAVACTSGSAALNYGPAISEAFYQQIPLVALTADRPPEWVDQQDGQTIRQGMLHQLHTKQSYQLPPIPVGHPDTAWQVRRQISEAYHEANAFPSGPVHINIPFREPFYPSSDEVVSFDSTPRFFEVWQGDKNLPSAVWQTLTEELAMAKKVLVVAGQQRKASALSTLLDSLPFPIIADVISNFHQASNAIKHQDAFLMNAEQRKPLIPDLLITFGNSVISKNLKLFLRNYQPKAHWHIQESGQVADTYQSLTRIINVKPERFWQEIAHRFEGKAHRQTYLETWRQTDKKASALHASFIEEMTTFGEFEAVHHFMSGLPSCAVLHLANSMSVRYANFVSVSKKSDVEVFANRGTSGIDGSTSTAVGHALAEPDKLHLLLTGDLAFFYDRNGLWHNHLPKNLRILLLNNHGGVIFRMIKGPVQQPELEPYFVTDQRLDARRTAEDFGIAYQRVVDRASFLQYLPTFLEDGNQTKILEVKTAGEKSQQIFESYKKLFQKQ